MHQKTAAILTFTDVRPEDKNALAKLSETIKVLFPVECTYNRPTTTIRLLRLLVTGVEENLGRRVWMLRQRRQKLLQWLSRFRVVSWWSRVRRRSSCIHPFSIVSCELNVNQCCYVTVRYSQRCPEQWALASHASDNSGTQSHGRTTPKHLRSVMFELVISTGMKNAFPHINHYQQ